MPSVSTNAYFRVAHSAFETLSIYIFYEAVSNLEECIMSCQAALAPAY